MLYFLHSLLGLYGRSIPFLFCLMLYAPYLAEFLFIKHIQNMFIKIIITTVKNPEIEKLKPWSQ